MKLCTLINFKNFTFLISFLLLHGCTINSSKQFDDQAIGIGLSKTVTKSGSFDIAIYSNTKQQSTILHVYIGGDGSPWIRNRYKAKDPTSTGSVVLDLIELDPNSAILLGRPCYHQYGKGRNCDAKWWTSHRYSIEIVDTMVAALQQYIAHKNIHNIVLIGFSGGGTLAILMAEKIERTMHVITINGNLDTDNWTQKHGFTPLYGSLNPVKRDPLPKKINQLHLFGGQDKNIDSLSIIQHYKNQQNVEIKVYPDNTHTKGWDSIWRDILKRLPPGR